MSKLWEVDPETKAKLLEIQKQNGNNSCVDCGAPSPQWASPKFGVFMCLNCSGIHRGLGVHISFIRSVTMDGFKVAELKRMQIGGNKPWQEFFNKHKNNQIEGRTFEDSTVKDRYDSDVGEEWKERLTAKVEGKEYVPGTKSSASTNRAAGASASAAGSRSQTPVGRGVATEASPARSSTPLASSQKAQNEAYFAKMGAENANRPADLPPSQGGKYSGFGSQPAPSTDNNGDWLSDMQKDPLAGLTKGFGWLRTSAQTGYEGWVKPNVQKLAESDLTAQARMAAAQIGQNVQAGTKTAAESFNRFVEGQDGGPPRLRSGSGLKPDPDKVEFWESFGASPTGPDKEKKEFWDSFGASPDGPEEDKREFWDSFGASPSGPEKGKKDFWDSFGQAPKGPDPNKKDFWDEFAAVGEAVQSKKQSSSIGTAAMRKTTGPATTGATGSTEKKDDWGEW